MVSRRKVLPVRSINCCKLITTLATLVATVGVVSLSGCATKIESLIPQGGPTIADIYDQHMKEVRGSSSSKANSTGASSTAWTAGRNVVAEGLDNRDRGTLMHTTAREVDARRSGL